MKTYRIYCFDANRHILSVDEIDVTGDEDAISQAHARDFGTMCEVWDERRLVAQLEAARREA
jgi:hypothetical protein